MDDFALQEFIDRHHGRLVGLLCLRGCGREDADDIAQEALVRLVQNWAMVSSFENPWAWLAKVAVNLDVSRWRRLAMMSRRVRLVHPPTEHNDPATFEALDLLRSLTERQRLAVVLPGLHSC